MNRITAGIQGSPDGKNCKVHKHRTANEMRRNGQCCTKELEQRGQGKGQILNCN